MSSTRDELDVPAGSPRTVTGPPLGARSCDGSDEVNAFFKAKAWRVATNVSALVWSLCSTVEAQNFKWATGVSGTTVGTESSLDSGRGVAVDGAGNVYTTGNFRGTADFDPGPGTFTLTAAGNDDIFVSKLDSSGNFLWAGALGGTSIDRPNAVAVDGAGNVYTTGHFRGTADFDPGAGTFSLTSAGVEDIFVSKLDSSGNFLWARAMGGTSIDEANDVAVDGAGNVYITGDFWGMADFDPGPGTFHLTPAGNNDIFVSKLDGSGNFLWAGAMGGVVLDEANAVAVDGAGNVYTTGGFRGTSDFDPGPGTFNLTSVFGRVFVSKLDSSGNFLFARAMDVGNGNDIAVDGAGNICTISGNSDIFVSKLDSSGDTIWVRAMGGAGTDVAFAVAIDGAGNVYTAGYFSGTADFDPGPGTFIQTSAGSADIFVSKLDSSGDFSWARAMGGVAGDRAAAVAVDGAGNTYTTGRFSATVVFDPGPGTFNLTSAQGFDIFVSKLGGPVADLVISKDDDQTTAIPGQLLTYTLTASNLGPFDVPTASVADLFPPGLNCSWICVGYGGAVCTAGPVAGDISDTVSLPAGSLAAYAATCALDSAATGFLVNTASILGSDDPVLGNNTAFDVDLLLPQADLKITKDDGQTTAVPGEQVTYTIVASNPAGPSDAPGSSVADVFSVVHSGCTWTCKGGGGGNCSANGVGDIADVADLPVGGTATYSATCTIDSGALGTLTNTATIATAAGVAELHPSDNSATDEETLTPQVDLGVTKTDGTAFAPPGEELTYTIVARNAGPSDALASSVEDLLPAELIDCSWICSPDPGVLCSGGPVLGNVVDSIDLPAGTAGTYTVDCTVDPAAVFQSFTNTAMITAAAGVTDTDTGNNSATDTDFSVDLIFTDSFESGDTTAWSKSSPITP